MSDAYTKLVSGIKEHQSPLFLEEYRKQILQDWTDGLTETNDFVSESEALSMAVGHNHEEYVDFLLVKSPVQAMITAGFSCSHLARAVESNRPVIIRKLLLHTLKLQPADQRQGVSLVKDRVKSKKTRHAMMRYLNKPSGCMMSGPSKTAVHIACEMGRANCLVELLHHGAVPTPKDNSGLTPIDHTLRKLCTDNKGTSPADAALALKELIPYLPVVRASPEIFELVRKKANQQDLPAEIRDILQWILEEMNTPRSLQQICKHQIRSVIGQSGAQPVPSGVFQLPLPLLMKQYLFAAI